MRPRQAIEWTPIGQTSNQLILYHPPSHALSVQPHPRPSSSRLLLSSNREYTPDSQTPIETIPRPAEVNNQAQTCPYCFQPLPTPHGSGGYFQILEKAHEGSRPPSPSPSLGEGRSRSSTPVAGDGTYQFVEGEVREEGMTGSGKGYYERYFREECRLGIGAEGSVFLATHIIGGNVLGQYAVKKIAVGSSSSYLVKMLREVRLLETLRHPNIIPYHHAWIDKTRFSSFGPSITALHVLMMYATAGNLDSFLLNRAHAQVSSTAEEVGDGGSIGGLPKEERIKAFKKRRQSRSEGVGVGVGVGGRGGGEMRGVMMLGLEEVITLFGAIVDGLAFLHANSILHLDLKCSNVLLHWEEGKLIPKAMISDFGTSEEMIKGKRERTGHTGTMEYMAPETLVINAQGQWRPSDSHADMWSLGLILHKLLFLHLPYADTEDFTALQAEIVNYPGFIPSAELIRACERRHIPRDLLVLLSKLVDIIPESRPSAEKVKAGLRSIDVRTPTSTFSGLVTRFTRPFESTNGILRRSPSINPNSEKDISRWKADISPVRPILALPSPEIKTLETIGQPWSRSPNMEWKNMKAVLFAIKILSLHPKLSSITVSGRTTIALAVLAIGSFALEPRTESPWVVGFTGLGIHIIVLFISWTHSSHILGT